MTGHRTPKRRLTAFVSLPPSMLADQWYKLARAMFLNLMSALSFDYANQALAGACLANRNHQPSAYFQLRHQGFRERGPTRSYKDSVIRSMGLPAQRPIESFHSRVVNSQFP